MKISQKNPVYVSKNTFKRNIILLLTEEKDQFHDVPIKEFNFFMFNQTLHSGRKHFCCYCLRSFSTVPILERHVNDCFEINDKQIIKMALKGETVKFKNCMKNIT